MGVFRKKTTKDKLEDGLTDLRSQLVDVKDLVVESAPGWRDDAIDQAKHVREQAMDLAAEHGPKAKAQAVALAAEAQRRIPDLVAKLPDSVGGRLPDSLTEQPKKKGGKRTVALFALLGGAAAGAFVVLKRRSAGAPVPPPAPAPTGTGATVPPASASTNGQTGNGALDDALTSELKINEK